MSLIALLILIVIAVTIFFAGPKFPKLDLMGTGSAVENQHANANPDAKIAKNLKIYDKPQHAIAIIVPCIPEDVPALDILVENIKGQTVQPNELVVGLSQTKFLEARKLEQKLQEQVGGKFKVKVTSIDSKAYAGGNRNRAVQASDSDLLFFMDADDVMSPYRIEHCLKVMKHLGNKPSVLLHAYRTGTEVSTMGTVQDKASLILTDLEKKVMRADKLYKLRNKRKYNNHNDPIFDLPCHHGHPIVKREVFKDVTFDESMKRAQDANFLNKCINHFKGRENGVYFVDLPLTYYKSRGQQKKQQLKQYKK